MFVGSLSTLLPHPWSCAPVLREEFVEFDKALRLREFVLGLFLVEDVNQVAYVDGDGTFYTILKISRQRNLE